MGLTVSQVARVSGVTVRTLHHYDQIGLLTPGSRSAAGYRLYLDGDLERLQEILFYRELGFGLDEIREMADRPDHDRAVALRHQRALLSSRVVHLEAMIEAVDAALEAEGSGMKMSKEDMFEVFGDFDPAEHAEEAKQRWPDKYAESTARTSGYSKDQWKEATTEMDDISKRFAAVAATGAAATSEEATALAEEHRLHIDRWYYECSPETHIGLADMYVADQRFNDYWEKYREGLAGYIHDAIWANATDKVG